MRKPIELFWLNLMLNHSTFWSGYHRTSTSGLTHELNNEKGAKGLSNADFYFALNSKIENLTDLVMRNMTQQTETGASAARANVSHLQEISCSYCEEKHNYNDCSRNPASVYYLGNS